jgi:dTDP-4-amino-4,6-dideoxygalactose transaminase
MFGSLYTHKPFCGQPGISITAIFRPTVQFAVPTWFEGRSVHYVHKARTAIRHVCDVLGLCMGTETLAPSYNCGSEIDPLLKSGTSVVLYRVDKNAKIDTVDLISRITKKTKAIYVTHYFGFPQDIKEIRRICLDRQIYLIEDCALSLFTSVEENPIGTSGHMAVFSFPKTLPVPDGGVLLVNDPRLQHERWSTSPSNFARIFRAMLPLLKSNFLQKAFSITFLQRLVARDQKPKTRRYFDNKNPVSRPELPASYYYDDRNSNVGLSTITKRLLETFDFTYIKNIRRKNFLLLLHLLSDQPNIKPLFSTLPEGVCPLLFPLVLENGDRDEVCIKLNNATIYSTPWWAGYHRKFAWLDFPDACYLKDRLIVLPIHQGLRSQEITFIAETLLKLI